jgi:hypothetical protein
MKTTTKSRLQNITSRTLTIAVFLMILTACASNQSKRSAIVPSGWASVSESRMFSADTKARLRRIEDDFGVMAMSVINHKITVTIGMLSTERMTAMQDAIHEVVGKDFTINVSIK